MRVALVIINSVNHLFIECLVLLLEIILPFRALLDIIVVSVHVLFTVESMFVGMLTITILAFHFNSLYSRSTRRPPRDRQLRCRPSQALALNGARADWHDEQHL